MINLARQVHEQADEAEDPDVARKARASVHPIVIAAGHAECKVGRSLRNGNNIAWWQTFATVQACSGGRHQKPWRHVSRPSSTCGLQKVLASGASEHSASSCRRSLRRSP